MITFKLRHNDFAAHMATVNFGIQVVEVLIAKRSWAEAKHYCGSVRRELLRAIKTVEREVDARDRTLKPLRHSSLTTGHSSLPKKGGRP